MLRRLKQRFIKEQFNPSWLGIIINPFYIARKALYSEVTRQLPRLSGKLLDVGCGQKPYKPYCKVEAYIGLEIDSITARTFSKADFFYDGTLFPFDNNSFDSIISSEVLEHVLEADQFLTELNRVLNIGGLLLITVPFIFCEHEQPHDYRRYTSFGIRAVIEKHGFEIIDQRKTVKNAGYLMQLLNAYLFFRWMKVNPYLLIVLNFICIPFTLLGLLGRCFSCEEFYFGNVILARKVR
ncbi:MAG: class I SAM-dependent methyltransferase [Gammaproteobacteria bacterium]|nr:class I SAM-dependent methyltransferase [Gammaproteobacteria bacterium]